MTIDTSEVESAVDSLVPGTLRYVYDPAGARGLGSSFADFQSVAIGTFLSGVGAPYYVVRLARDRLVVVLGGVRTMLQTLLTATGDATRSVQPVTKTATLTNARVALEQLTTSLQSRTGSYQSITEIPSFTRYKQNVEQFLSDEGKKATSRGALVDSPSVAKAKLTAGTIQLRAMWDDMLTRVSVWANSMDTFASLSLPTILSSNIMQNVRDALTQQVDQLNALAPEERLLVLRDLVVSLLSGVATVEGFGSLTPPTLFIPMTGVGEVYADSTHPAEPATLPSDYHGYYSTYVGSNDLEILVDGQYYLSLLLPGSFVARMDCLYRGPFVVDATKASFHVTNEWNLGNGTTSMVTPITLPAGTLQPWQIVQAINTQATAVVAHLFHTFSKTTQEVSAVNTSGSTWTFTLIGPTTWDALGVVVGDTVLDNEEGSSARDSIWDVTDVAGAVLTATFRTGSAPSLPQVLQVSVGTDANLRFFIQLADVEHALDLRATMLIVDALGSEGTLTQLGLFSGASIDSVRTSATSIINTMNKSTSIASLDGIPRLALSSRLDNNVHLGKGRTNPEDSSLITFYAVREEVTVVSTTATTTTLRSAAVAALGVGAWVVIRSSSASADIGTYGRIVSLVGSDEWVINTVVVGVGSVLVEAAPTSFYEQSNTRNECLVTIGEDTPFDGVYQTTTRPGATPLDVYLSSRLFNHMAAGGGPVFLMSLAIGRQRVVFESEDTTMKSSVSILGSGDAEFLFFGGSFPPARTQEATSIWVKLPSIPQGLEAGDFLEHYGTNRTVPTFSEEIVSIDRNSKIIQLANPISSVPLSFDGTPTHLAKLRKGVHQNFESVSAEVKTWLNRPINDVLKTFRDLDTALTPLKADNPTLHQAVAAKQLLGNMLDAIDALEASLGLYSAEVVPSVDSLLKGFLQKSLDRAVDTLLAADFAGFFTLDMESGSYAGNLQKNLRSVQKEDFPVRKDNRNDSVFAAAEQTIAQYESSDFEYTADQIDPVQKAIDISEPSSPNIRMP